MDGTGVGHHNPSVLSLNNKVTPKVLEDPSETTKCLHKCESYKKVTV